MKSYLNEIKEICKNNGFLLEEFNNGWLLQYKVNDWLELEWTIKKDDGILDGLINLSIFSSNLKTIKEYIDFFEEQDFRVYDYGENGEIDIETWTDGGVNMFITLERNNIYNSLNSYILNFDIEEEIDLHRQDERYKNDFTITESLKDFRSFEERLLHVLNKLFYFHIENTKQRRQEEELLLENLYKLEDKFQYSYKPLSELIDKLNENLYGKVNKEEKRKKK